LPWSRNSTPKIVWSLPDRPMMPGELNVGACLTPEDLESPVLVLRKRIREIIEEGITHGFSIFYIEL
jgi:hypothetical protein